MSFARREKDQNFRGRPRFRGEAIFRALGRTRTLRRSILGVSLCSFRCCKNSILDLISFLQTWHLRSCSTSKREIRARVFHSFYVYLYQQLCFVISIHTRLLSAMLQTVGMQQSGTWEPPAAVRAAKFFRFPRGIASLFPFSLHSGKHSQLAFRLAAILTEFFLFFRWSRFLLLNRSPGLSAIKRFPWANRLLIIHCKS